MLPHQTQDTTNLGPTEATAFLKANRIEPDLGPILITLDVDVRRLLAVTREEEEPVGTGAENSRHELNLRATSAE